MTNTIDQISLAAQRRTSFISDALEARQQMFETGKGYDAVEVHAYIQMPIKNKTAGVTTVRLERRSYE